MTTLPLVYHTLRSGTVTDVTDYFQTPTFATRDGTGESVWLCGRARNHVEQPGRWNKASNDLIGHQSQISTRGWDLSNLYLM
jgi:hypothetical protein